MPVQFISRARYFRIGEKAPKNSCFRGTVTPESIFGGSGSYFSYTERYVGKRCDSLMNYTGRYGSTVSSDGELDSEEKIDAFRKKGLEALGREGAVCYEFVISLKDYDTASNYAIVNQEQFSSVIKTIMPSWLKSIGLDPNNVSWWEDFHPENRTSIVPHPHVHLLFFENEPSGTFDRSYGKLPKRALGDFKRMFASRLLKREYSGRYRQLFDDINVSRKRILDRTRHADLSKVKDLKDLYAVMPSSGRLQINSANMIPYREAVFRVVDSLLESEECADEWHSYLEALQRYDSYIRDESGNDVSSRKDFETAKMRDQIANHILSGRKGFRMDSSDEIPAENNGSSKAGGRRSDSASGYGSLAAPVKEPSNSAKKLISGLLAKRRREIEQEIESYLNQNTDSLNM